MNPVRMMRLGGEVSLIADWLMEGKSVSVIGRGVRSV
jgi:hypothetical protein